MNRRLVSILFFLVLLSTANFAYAREIAAPVVIPEPISSALFLLGGGALAVRKYLKKR